MDSSGGDVAPSGGGGGGIGQLGVSFGAGFLGGLVGGSGGGLKGSAIRGALQYNALLSQLGLRQLVFQTKIAQAQAALPSFAPGEHPILEVTPVVTPQTKALAANVIKAQTALYAARGTRREARAQAAVTLAEKRRAALAARLAPQADVRYIAQYGIASGQPVRGSRDDPEGALYPNVTHSLFLGG